MQRSRCLTLASLSWLALATPALAQTLRGAVLDSASRQPIRGAVLVLLDSSGAMLARQLTDDRGQYRVAFAPEMRQMQVLRIGYRPRMLNMPPLSSVAAPLDIAMIAIPTLLEPVRVREDARCPKRGDRAAAFGLWEQARAGLLATIVARDAAPARMKRLGFGRFLEDDGDRITNQRVTVDSSERSLRSWRASHSGADFVQTGFTEDSAGTRIFFGPDADVLLEESFALGYCFHIMDPVRTRPSQIGLGFAPLDRRRGRVDVTGALWIDTLARALSDIEFRYVGLAAAVEAIRPGGRVAFRAMANGVVLIDRWALRLVGVSPETLSTGTARPEIRRRYDRQETGGELASARWPNGYRWNASLGTLRIHAITSQGKPAPGTVVRLVDTDYLASADSAGDLTIADLLPGPYAAVVVDPSLAPLLLTLPTSLRFVAARDSVVRVRLDVPTVEEYVERACEAARRFVSGPVWLLARVMTPDGRPVEGVRWTLSELTGPAQWRVLAEGGRTGSNGLFQFCGVSASAPKAGVTVEIRTWREGFTPQVVVRQLTQKVTVVPVVWNP